MSTHSAQAPGLLGLPALASDRAESLIPSLPTAGPGKPCRGSTEPGICFMGQRRGCSEMRVTWLSTWLGATEQQKPATTTSKLQPDWEPSR